MSLSPRELALLTGLRGQGEPHTQFFSTPLTGLPLQDEEEGDERQAVFSRWGPVLLLCVNSEGPGQLWLSSQSLTSTGTITLMMCILILESA